MEKYADKLKDLLATEPTFTVEDKINKNYVASLARQYDKKLLELLSSDKELAEFFFVDINGSKIFKKDTFLSFINNKEFLPDSYTIFKSKIGLGVDADNYLSEDSRVVLNWPYKDCILEGGQDRDDQKRKEVFFNEVLAPDQINTILDDKVFVNWKRYDKDGEHDLDELKPDDNLIIKGNNLVVLHSLKKRFAGKVKLIYIDPPYNTGNDGFNYNDAFSHSSWLTFIKNRLVAAKELLRNDGSIMVSCDDNEQAYLKVLMDELFGRENFVSAFIWQKKTSGSQHSKHILDFHEYILVYAKDINQLPTFKMARTEEQISSFKYEDEYVETRGRYLVSPLKSWLDYRKTLIYPIEMPDGTIQETQWVCAKTTFEELKKDGRIEFRKSKDGNWSVYKKQYITDRGGEVMPPSILVNSGQSSNGTKELKNLFNDKVFSNPKPEKLLHDLIYASTDEKDIVMDFCLGSGTTAAVAHKMGRQYIGIEQMNYVDDVTCKRLKMVVAGESGGISKDVNWTGGGSFVYCNIKNDANIFREKVRHSDEKDLEGLLDQVLKSSFLSYRVDPKKVSKKEFEKLSLADKKRILIELVDNNTLYLNYSEINDNTYNISEADKKHNKEFYGD